MRKMMLSLAAMASVGLVFTAGCSKDDGGDNGSGSGGSSAEGGVGIGGAAGAGPTGGGFVTGGTDQGGQGSGATGGNLCGDTRLNAEPIDVNVLLVLDASGSMTSGEDKWAPLTSAIGDVIEGVGDQIAFGLEIFPFYEEGAPCAEAQCCGVPEGDAAIRVPIGPGTETGPTIVSTLEAYAPTGLTPTAVALQQALDYYTTGAGAELTGNKYVLLGTDGGPNCNAAITCAVEQCTSNIEGICPADPANCCDSTPVDIGARLCLDSDRTTAQVKALADAGIRTIVVGLPGANREEYTQLLDALAVEGQQTNPSTTSEYFPVADTAELVSVLQTVTNELIRSCDLMLTSAPPNIDDLKVKIDGTEVPKEGEDGWEVLDPLSETPTIRLMGTTCDRMMLRGASSIEVVYGCPDIL